MILAYQSFCQTECFASSLRDGPSRETLANLIAWRDSFEGKSGFVSHTKLIAEVTFMDLFHS